MNTPSKLDSLPFVDTLVTLLINSLISANILESAPLLGCEDFTAGLKAIFKQYCSFDESLTKKILIVLYLIIKKSNYGALCQLIDIEFSQMLKNCLISAKTEKILVSISSILTMLVEVPKFCKLLLDSEYIDLLSEKEISLKIGSKLADHLLSKLYDSDLSLKFSTFCQLSNFDLLRASHRIRNYY